MRYAIKLAVLLLAAGMPCFSLAASDGLRENILKNRAKDAGFVPPADVMPAFSPSKSAAGRLLFESKKLSMSGEIACKNCHLDRFGSTDGIPNAIGTGGEGEGLDRIRHGGDILPRNALPLWGRGSKGFDVFFWDGRVDKSDGATVKSQFGDAPPSSDPLIVAAHLPMVEIREMVPDAPEADKSKTETVESAVQIYAVIERRLQSDPELSRAISQAFQVEPADIKIKHVAESLAEFFRDRFRLRDTQFHRFVFDGGGLHRALSRRRRYASRRSNCEGAPQRNHQQRPRCPRIPYTP